MIRRLLLVVLLAGVLGACANSPVVVVDVEPTPTTRPVAVASEDAEVSGVLAQGRCDDDGACAAGLTIDGVQYVVSCGAIDPEFVTDDVVGRGRYSGGHVELRRLATVDRSVMVAVSLDGGLCGDGDVALSPWSMAFVGGAPPQEVDEAICKVAVDEHRKRNGCHE